MRRAYGSQSKWGNGGGVPLKVDFVHELTMQEGKTSYDIGLGKALVLKLVGAPGDEKPMIDRYESGPALYMSALSSKGVVIENLKLWAGLESGSATVKDCLLLGHIAVPSRATLSLEDSVLQHPFTIANACIVHAGGTLRMKATIVRKNCAGVNVEGNADIQDCIFEDSSVGDGICVTPTGSATISGSTVQHDRMAGIRVEGEATVKDSIIKANDRNGIFRDQGDLAKTGALRSRGGS